MPGVEQPALKRAAAIMPPTNICALAFNILASSITQCGHII
jgi:hypothetical protein